MGGDGVAPVACVADAGDAVAVDGGVADAALDAAPCALTRVVTPMDVIASAPSIFLLRIPGILQKNRARQAARISYE
ncbi:protein of unknown function [Pararobbsia alpina]